jgi:hypothetical protein
MYYVSLQAVEVLVCMETKERTWSFEVGSRNFEARLSAPSMQAIVWPG